MTEAGYAIEKSDFGNVFYKVNEVRITENAIVKYAEYPWITRFEVEGIDIIRGDQNEYGRDIRPDPT